MAVSGTLSAEGTVVGIPAYMAFEQHRGAEVGPAADQYALCVVLFEVLHGRRPFDAPDVDTLLAHKEQRRIAPGNGRVPGWIDRVARRGLPPRPTRVRANAEPNPAEIALARRRALARAGKYGRARAELERASRLARPLLGTRVAYEQGRVLDDQGADRLAAQALIELIYVVGVSGSRHDEGLRVAELARAKLARKLLVTMAWRGWAGSTRPSPCSSAHATRRATPWARTIW